MRHNVLYLDDNEKLTGLLAQYMGERGIQTDCASTVQAARALLAARTYSVVLLDLRLSGSKMDGFELACDLETENPWLPIILLTACGTPAIETWSIRHRVRVVYKPKPLSELCRIIQEVLVERYFSVEPRAMSWASQLAQAES